jgi:5-formyltetrahydrofolate cyclo-ligase
MDQAVASWRRQQRATLLGMRQAISLDERARAAEIIAGKLDLIVAMHRVGTIGLYWPIKQEVNLMAWAGMLERQGHLRLSLPVVVTPKAPLEYWRWTSGDDLARGIWNIPVPAQRDVVRPDLLLAPLVGFDQAKYRLGYGGGYFDRTLGSLSPRPIVVGVGYDFSALDTIFPQPHDIPMDGILTEHRDMLPPDWRTHAV